MKNIGIIIQKLKNGGAERAAANLSIDLSEKYNVYLIVFDSTDITYKYAGNLIDLKLPPQKSIFGKLRYMIKRISKVKKIKKQYNLDYCISFLTGANIVNVLSKQKEKAITSERNYMSFFSKGKLDDFIIKYVCKKADKIVSLSKLVKEDLVNYYKVDSKKVIPIYNSCDRERLYLTSDETEKVKASLENNNRYIITMGRLSYQKGQWHLIKAMRLVKEQFPNAKLLILGKGELEDDLKKLTKNMNMENDVQFLGYLKNPHTILEKCEIFVFSSIVEGLGNVLLEALAFNKVIVSTDCLAGPREIVAPDSNINARTNKIEYAKYGVLVPAFSKEKLDSNDVYINEEERIMAEAIIKLMQNRQLEEKYERSSEERIKDFSPEVIKKQWFELLQMMEEENKNEEEK